LALLIALSVPLALKNMKRALVTTEGHPQAIASLDQETAQLHLAFGIMLIIAFVLARLMR
jgi:1,4-dihydroxy-2-naphthoate octaprenyltransferase